MLEQPEAYNVRILPTALKKEITDKYKLHLAWIDQQTSDDEQIKQAQKIEFQSCIDYMNAVDDSGRIAEFKVKCAELDSLRKENCREVFPELARHGMFD